MLGESVATVAVLVIVFGGAAFVLKMREQYAAQVTLSLVGLLVWLVLWSVGLGFLAQLHLSHTVDAVLNVIWFAASVGGVSFGLLRYYRSAREKIGSTAHPVALFGPRPLDFVLLESELRSFVATKVRAGGSYHSVDDMTIEFLATALPEWHPCRPRQNVYFRNWIHRPDLTPELRSLGESARTQIQARVNAMKAEAVRKDSEAGEREALDIIRRNADKIEMFLSIAYRKVARPDDYGDENPRALYEEMYRLIVKLADTEPKLRALSWWFAQTRKSKDWQRALTSARDSTVNALVRELTARFRVYYRDRRANPTLPNSSSVASRDGRDFELHLAGLLQSAGAKQVSSTPQTGDQGADLLFSMNGKRYVIQAKFYSGSVGNKAVQEAFSARGYYGCDVAWVITNARFTNSARTLAKELGVVLVDGEQLQRFNSFPAEQFAADKR